MVGMLLAHQAQQAAELVWRHGVQACALGGARGLDQALEHGVVIGRGVGVGGFDVGRGLAALRYLVDCVIEAGRGGRGASGAAGARGPCFGAN